ncbi:unnamed protein product [Ceutorhynchus assimilis]|uniref:AAA+ ATPase domain-containing protein n=1 Tax=Ceutorhynchus assimilis TaxID=467358 RepID=A0A9N9N0F2_9CUCU|nr:unnamed protein product [Ceutorhynchus assimilis]
MKNITDYFTSPTKATKSSIQVVNTSGSPKDQNVSPNNTSLKSPKERTDKAENKKKLTKKKKKRKPTDPEVKSIAELFSNNLSIISPNTSGTNNKSTDKNQERKSLQTPIKSTIKSKESSTKPTTKKAETNANNSSSSTKKSQPLEESSSQQTPKINAFQFLMNSRNNIIGQNTGGKEDDSQNDSHCEDKQKLEARKNLFKNWADRKGAGKRKRQEEEVEKCIDIKMKKRVKRLKNLIEGEKKKEPQSKIKKKVEIISSSESENSRDSVTEKTETLSVIEVEENSQDVSISTKSSVKKQEGNNFVDEFDGEDSEYSFPSSFDDSPKQTNTKNIIKIKMFTPLSKISNKSSLGSNKEKHNKSKNQVKLDDSLNDFCSPVKKTAKTFNKNKVKSSVKAKKDIAKVSKQTKENLEDCQVIITDESSNDSDLIIISNSKINKQLIIDDDSNSNIECLKRTTKEEEIVSLIDDVVDTPGRSLRKRSVINYTETLGLPKNIKIKSTNKTKNSTKDCPIETIDLFSNKDSNKDKKQPKKTPVKLAPLFKKLAPKPKLDPEVVEARRQFLISGVPDSLKKTIRKQKSNEEREYDVFPTISHVQQKCDSQMWNMPEADLNLKKPISPNIDTENLKCENLIARKLPYEINITTKVEKVKNIKGILQQIKTENPDYPVFKVFRHIYEKSGKQFLNEIPNNKKSPKKQTKKRKSKCLDEVQADINNIKDHEMWTEKYKPRSSEEILGNLHSVTELKKWLEIWMNYRQEIKARNRKRCNSESEFESTDCDSRDSMCLPGNTIVLYGPTGSGKSSAVYAIANELGFNVLELNASTKRTGKKLLNDLQEATQSHQVKKNGPFSNLSVDKSEDKKRSKSMCILFMEDIDLIFEQDEGFLSSLNQLILTSKRPIILTTTDNTPVHVQKFISQYECIRFMPLSMHCLGIWLHIVCLVEGILADKDDLGILLDYNKGDIRKTLLEIQFWSLTGGQLEKNKRLPIKNFNDVELSSEIKHDTKEFVHKHCLGSFEIFRENKEHCIPQNMDLGLLWWNVPNILNLPSCPSRRLSTDKIQNSQETPEILTEIDTNKLNSMSELYDSLTLCDLLKKKVNCCNSNEPIVKNWSAEVLESLELIEREEDGKGVFVDLVQELTHNVLDGCIENYKKVTGTSYSLNMALPDSKERKWRANQHMCEDFLKGPIPLSNTLERKSVALDYLSTLRHIARSEQQRAIVNTKRSNRFRHYLKDFVHFKQNHCDFACNILKID